MIRAALVLLAASVGAHGFGARAAVAQPRAIDAAPPPPAAATLDERDTFYRGVELERQGKFDEAAETYRALADRSPEDPFADDALRELGRLYEEKLADPVRAAETYERLLRDHPRSRLAALARARVEFLRGALGPENQSVRALAELNEIFFGMARRPRSETIDRLERLLAEHPSFAEAPRAAYRLAVMHLEDGRTDAALARFREIVERWPGSEWGPRAQRGVGDVFLARGDTTRAAEAYRAMFRWGDESVDLAAAEALERVGQERWRLRLTWVARVVVALFLVSMLVSTWRSAGSARAAARALIRPPLEALYFLPIAALFAAAAMTEHAALGHAVEWIVAGGLVVSWLSGVALDAARARVGRASLLRVVAHAAACTVAIAAVSYIAVTREQLWDMLKETLAHGAER